MTARAKTDPRAGAHDAITALRDAGPASTPSTWRPPPAFDEYRVLELVGRGGMGEVYRGHDDVLDRPVAIKFIGSLDPDPAARERFLWEARAAARLQHPNVLTVYRVGELEGRPYLITEFIQGRPLDEIVTPMPWERALSVGVGLARGLAAAHRRGVLHRDVKPGNAIVTVDGEVKLLDFGLAKLIDGGPPPMILPPVSGVAAPTLPSAAKTEAWESPRGGTLVSVPAEDAACGANNQGRPLTGGLVGTPDYMAPELWRYEPASRRSDVYALGALLFELCAGRRLHGSVPPRALSRHVQEHDAPLLTAVAPSVSPKLAAIIERCLRREPSERYASGDELREALEQIELTSRSRIIPVGNPYRGLHPFEAEHRALFFGRQAEIGTLLERLRVDPMVVVAGDSGTGKSSLCRAGVLPAASEGLLGGGRAWSVVRSVPGRTPLYSLGCALAPLLGIDESAVARRLRSHPTAIAPILRKRLADDAGLVLFVDQLEELITMADACGAARVAEVLGHLATGLPGVRLLMTVRSDFLAPVAALPGLGDELARAIYFLKPLSQDAIRDAITGPAHATGVGFEPDRIVDALVEATSTADGGLPLLQFALAELWEARDPAVGAITGAAVDKIGGVAGALARHADAVILRMTAVQRSAARRILLDLVSLQGTPVRRREDELAGDAASRAALNGLVTGRLVMAKNGEQGATYELAHEALLWGWTTFRRWQDEQVGSREVRHRLSLASKEWERLARAPEALWSGLQLAEVAVVDLADLPPRERAFVETSRRVRARVKLARKARVAGVFLVALASVSAVRIGARHRAALLVEQGRSALRSANDDAEGGAALAREAFARFDAFDCQAGEDLWEQTLALTAHADQMYRKASEALETARLLDAADNNLSALFGDTLRGRALLARRERRLELYAELVQRMVPYDDGGERRKSLDAPAVLALHTVPEGAYVALQRYDEMDHRRRLGAPANLGPTPVEDKPLAPGSYVLTFAMAGRAPTVYPILLAPGERIALKIPVPFANVVPDGFVYVAAGRFLSGSAADEETRRTFYDAPPLHESSTGPFLIAREETTFAEWITFLRDLGADERARHAPRVQGLTGALALRELPGNDWELTLQPAKKPYTARLGQRIHYEGRDRRADQDWLRFPVSGISPEDAEAYVAWLSRTGRVPGARLCTEREWERAARGADDREFPHGDRLAPDDADIDQTYGKEPLAFGPDEVGSHPASRSPFGIDDMCGNVFEWTRSSLAPNEHVLRGGGFYYDLSTARIANRQVPEPTIHDANLGLRVCATLEP
jgi:serine/threonine protein kinase/formylglycine-generating enzyme required for sulfatase activity